MRDGERQKPEALPGSLHVQRVRCGKLNCRCARGQLHTAHYRFWREGGRLRKAYVRRAEVEAVRAACEEWRRDNAVLRSITDSADGDRQRAQTRAMLRGAGLEKAATAGHLRSRTRGWDAAPDVFDLLEGAGLMPRYESSFFRFGKR